MWIIQLVQKKDMGPGYVELATEPARQPPERIIEAKGLLQERLSLEGSLRFGERLQTALEGIAASGS